MATNNIKIERAVSKGCPQGSCLGTGLWNIFYNSLLNLTFKNSAKIIAFADDLLLVIRGKSARELKYISNTELKKFQRARENEVRFNDKKLKTMLMTGRKSKERQDLGVYLFNKPIRQVKTLKYPGIIIDSKLNSGSILHKRRKNVGK